MIKITKSAIIIIISLSLFLFVEYNVMTVDASKEEEPTEIDGLFEDELEREDVDKYCDASEDYNKHPKQCHRYYKVVEKLEEDRKKRVDEYNKNTPIEDRPVTCDGGMSYSAAGTVCSDFKKNQQSEDELNDGWYGGPRDSEGNLIPFEDIPDSEYDDEDRAPLKYEKAYREYLKKEYDMDLDGKEYWKIPRDEKIEMEKEFEEQKEDKYRDITTAGEDVEGFERFVEEKKGTNYNFETDYHWETPEEQMKLEEEFNEMKLKRAGEDLKPPEEIPMKGVGPDIVEILANNEILNKFFIEKGFTKSFSNEMNKENNFIIFCISILGLFGYFI